MRGLAAFVTEVTTGHAVMDRLDALAQHVRAPSAAWETGEPSTSVRRSAEQELVRREILQSLQGTKGRPRTVLQLVAIEGPLSIGEMAGWLQRSPTELRVLVRALVQAGLLEVLGVGPAAEYQLARPE